MSKGLLIVLSGPSGVGKGTIRDLFVNDSTLNLGFSISMTSRSPRNGEVNGKDYYFVTRDEFEEAIKNDQFLEYTEFVGNYYGTLKSEVERIRNLGKNVLLEIEVEGATNIAKQCKDAITIFITPPSIEELERRIRGRRSEPEEIVQQRLAKATKELQQSCHYKYVVCNDDVKLASDIVSLIIKKYMEVRQ